MSSITLSVPEIHCGHCKASIEGAVAPLAGVENVTVDIAGRTVDVTYAEPANLAQISAVIVDAGYDVAAVVNQS